MRPFQIVLIGIFAAFGLGGLLIFAAFRGFGGDVDPMARGVEIWGTIDSRAFQSAISALGDTNDAWGSVRYVRKDERTFEKELVDAIAEGTGPDVVLLPHDLIASQNAKLLPIPYDNYPVRDFKNAFIDGAEIFLLPKGVYAVPVAVDPIVMYWNRSIFASSGLANPPRTWSDLVGGTVPAITVRDGNNNILRSAVGLGEFQNITNAKAILVMLMRQAGSELATVNDNGFRANLNLSKGNPPAPPGDAAVRFFTDFANPSSMLYSWNRGLPNDKNMFLSGDLAIYFGFGSEFKEIEEGNANLDFDVAEVPQGGTGTDLGYGTIYGLAIARGAKNPEGAYLAVMGLGTETAASIIASEAGLAPALRGLISGGSSDAVHSVLYRAALIARGWFDPSPEESDTIFRDMITNVTSGRSKINEAVSDASSKLQYAF